MNRTDTSRVCRADSASEPTPSSTPVIDSISPSTWAPYRRASATTSTVCRWFSSTGSCEASNSTEFQPTSRHSVITERSGQWSRCSETGTSMPAVMDVHIAYSTPLPIDLTVFTDVWTISGERSATAASRTPARLMSLKMLIAGTPYRCSSAGSTICLSETTGTRTSLCTGECRSGRAPRRPADRRAGSSGGKSGESPLCRLDRAVRVGIPPPPAARCGDGGARQGRRCGADRVRPVGPGTRRWQSVTSAAG